VNPTEAEARLQAILNSPTYRLAAEDVEFLDRPDLRPVRMLLELLKPEEYLTEAGVRSTIVVFGGTQVHEDESARRRLAAAEAAAAADPADQALARQLARARRNAELSKYYDAAREFARLVSSSCQIDGHCDYVVVTGGGPGVMEAGNRGAYDAGAKSIGFNITLPHEQAPNPYITPELCFQFRYFAMRKFHFLLRARGLVAFPGGFGTFDELFEVLCLRQTGRMQSVPVILYGREFWEDVLPLERLADRGLIADEHLELVEYADSPHDAWDKIQRYHRLREKRT
jgi:hypothetical protein